MMEGGGGSGFRGFGSTGEQGSTFGRGFGTPVGGSGDGGWGRGGGSSSSDASVVFGKDNSSAKLSANSGFGFGSSQSTWSNNNSAWSNLSSVGFGGGIRPSGFKSTGTESLRTSGTDFGKAVGSGGGVGGSASRFGFGSSSLHGGGGGNTLPSTSGILTTTSGGFGAAASFSDGGNSKSDNTTPSQRGGSGFGVPPQAMTATRDFKSTFTQLKQGGFGTESSSVAMADEVDESAASKGFSTVSSLPPSLSASVGGFGTAPTTSKGFVSAAGGSDQVGEGGTLGRQPPMFGTTATSNRFGSSKTFGSVVTSNAITQQPSIVPLPGHSFTAAGTPVSGSSSNDMPPPAPPNLRHKNNDLELNKRRPSHNSSRIMGMTASETEAMKTVIHQAPQTGFLESGGSNSSGGIGSYFKHRTIYEKKGNSQEQNGDISESIEVGADAGETTASEEEGAATMDGVQVEWERRDFADAVALIGRNELMCSSKEVDERTRMDDLRMLEREHVNHCKPDGTPYRTHEMAIKKFKRVTPGTRKDDPAEVRTPRALQMTMDYLEDAVIPKGSSYVWGGNENDPRIENAVIRMKWGEESASDEVEYEVYKYVWDRTREIRGDYSMQGFQMAVGRLDSVMDLSVFERIARWHICMDHRLHGNVAYDRGNNAAQNLEQLKATLGSLLELYCVARWKVTAGGNPKEFTSPHEAELCAYHLLLNLDQDGGSMALSLVQEWIDNAPEVARSVWVRRALKVLVARKNGNFSFLFRELSTAPYLFRCCLFMYVSLERSQALRCMQAMRTYPLDDLIDLLAFQSRDKAIDFVTAHGLKVDVNNDVFWFSSKGERMFVEPSRLPVALKMEATIEGASRGFGIKDIIHGKALPKDGLWGRALSPNGQNDVAIATESQDQKLKEQAMQARVIQALKRSDEERQKKRNEDAKLVELERLKKFDAERKAKEAEERAKKASFDKEQKRLKALRLREEKERLVREEQETKAKHLLEQKKRAEEEAERAAARALEERKRLAEEKAEKFRWEEEKRWKKLQEKERKEAEERLRKATEERRREAEQRARIADNRKRLKLAIAFYSQRMLSFAVNTWHTKTEEMINLWRLEYSRRKRNREAIASTDISLMGQPLLKRVVASGDLIIRQRMTTAAQQFASVPLGHVFYHDGGGGIHGSNSTLPSQHLQRISPELSALAISRYLPSSTPYEPEQLFRILVIHSESAPQCLTRWLEGCLGIHGGYKNSSKVIVGEVMCALSSGGGHVCVCARRISMEYDTTTSSLVEHFAVASAALFALSVSDSVLPDAVASLSRVIGALPEGIPVARLFLADEVKSQHQMREGEFLSWKNYDGTTNKILRPHRSFAVKNGNENEWLKVLEFLAVNVPSSVRPIVIGRPVQDMLEYCINHAIWRSSSRSSSSSTTELLTALRSAVESMAKRFEESSTNVLSGWPPDEFASAEGKNGSRVIKNGALLEGSGPIGEPSLRVGPLPVNWRMESTRMFQKAMEALTLRDVSGNNMHKLGGVTSADKPQLELCSKSSVTIMTDSCTLLAFESQLRANIQCVLNDCDLVYSPPFEINWWFEEQEEKQKSGKIVKEKRRRRINESYLAACMSNQNQSSDENNKAGIISLDPVSQPPCPTALDTPVTVSTVKLCASLQKQQAARRDRLGNAVSMYIRSVSWDIQRLSGILQKHIKTRISSSHSVTSCNNLGGHGNGYASPMVGDVDLMIHGIREERKASENTEKCLQTAVGDWKSAAQC